MYSTTGDGVSVNVRLFGEEREGERTGNDIKERRTRKEKDRIGKERGGGLGRCVAKKKE